MPPSSKSKYWCFTLNNATSEEEQSLRSIVAGEAISYLVFGKEVGESGTPHLQGYVEFLTRKTLAAVKSTPGFRRTHLESRRGTSSEADIYCRKDGDVYAIGTLSISRRGKRTDLDSIKTLIDEGTPEAELWDTNFSTMVYHRRAFREYRACKKPATFRLDLKVYVLWGAPGVGKSRYAYHINPELYSVPDPSLKWFDNYQGEETILIDDYRGAADSSFLLKLLDIYKLQVPVKGGFLPWHARKIYITSNVPPSQWHQDIEAPLLRRLHKIVEVKDSINFEDLSEFNKNFE